MNVHWQRLLILLCAAFGMTGALGVSGALAQIRRVASWEQLSPPGPVYRLFTPAGGVVYALTGSGLYRSDDAATSWSLVPVPHETPKGGGVYGIGWAPSITLPDVAWQPFEIFRVAVDPTDPQTIYSDTLDGIGKSVDGGQTWTTVMPLAGAGRGTSLLELAVSTADGQLVYATTGLDSSGYGLHRSRDGGATWETILSEPNYPGGFWFHPLYPHPTNTGLYFYGFGASRGEYYSFVRRDGTETLRINTLTPGSLVTMTHSRASKRLYLLTKLGPGEGGSSSSTVSVSSAGDSWEPVLQVGSGGGRGMGVARTVITAMTPAADDQGIYVGLQDFARDRTMLTTEFASGIVHYRYGDALQQRSSESRELSAPGMGWVYDLALTLDGAYLYAATENGLWRLPDPATQGR